ncbi:MAG: homocysteine biosynthesis protein [Methanobacteriaceae archaeon]|nr:homocysteine biosynthesis protein [Methanobacteriaceae archaeon]
MKTIEEINQKIDSQDATIITALEMTDLVDEIGTKQAAKEVDIVTTGTFGAMCSSGAILNFGHTDPPIKMNKTILNGVEAYSGLAAVDAYIGAGQINNDPYIKENYGGAHVIEDLINKKEIKLKTESYTTDCYPLKKMKTTITIDDLNQAIMLNPRNCYQNYAAATNSRNETIKTYMGTLLPNHGNITYSSAGALSPLLNDPYFETIGPGTNIFLCGAQGQIISEGTQHVTETERYKDVPISNAGTIMVTGNMKEMQPEYIKAAAMPDYGSTLYVAIGIPIPILNEDMARYTSIKEEDIKCNIVDYGIPKLNRPTIKQTNYKELRSGKIELNGEEIPTSPMSSYKKSIEIAEELKNRIEKQTFTINTPTRRLKHKGCIQKPLKMKQTKKIKDILPTTPTKTVTLNENIKTIAEKLIKNNINHVPVTTKDKKILGIITSWDITKALTNNTTNPEKIMTKKVITAYEDEPIDTVARRLSKHNISAIPIINKTKQIKGLITVEDISRTYSNKK